MACFSLWHVGPRWEAVPRGGERGGGQGGLLEEFFLLMWAQTEGTYANRRLEGFFSFMIAFRDY